MPNILTFILFNLLTAFLVVLKLIGAIELPWVIVLAPFFIPAITEIFYGCFR